MILGEDDRGECEACGSELIPHINDTHECGVCMDVGCSKCMVPGDDVYPWLCVGCAD